MTEILIEWRDGMKVSAKRKAEIRRLAHVRLLRESNSALVEMSIVTPNEGVTVHRAIHNLERYHEVQFAEVNQKYYAQ
jgi:hypothetical protein